MHDTTINILCNFSFVLVRVNYFVILACNLAGSKIVFANGSQDPWRHASKQTSSPGSEFCNARHLSIYSGDELFGSRFMAVSNLFMF